MTASTASFKTKRRSRSTRTFWIALPRATSRVNPGASRDPAFPAHAHHAGRADPTARIRDVGVAGIRLSLTDRVCRNGAAGGLRPAGRFAAVYDRRRFRRRRLEPAADDRAADLCVYGGRLVGISAGPAYRDSDLQAARLAVLQAGIRAAHTRLL